MPAFEGISEIMEIGAEIHRSSAVNSIAACTLNT